MPSSVICHTATCENDVRLSIGARLTILLMSGEMRSVTMLELMYCTPWSCWNSYTTQQPLLLYKVIMHSQYCAPEISAVELQSNLCFTREWYKPIPGVSMVTSASSIVLPTHAGHVLHWYHVHNGNGLLRVGCHRPGQVWCASRRDCPQGGPCRP